MSADAAMSLMFTASEKPAASRAANSTSSTSTAFAERERKMHSSAKSLYDALPRKGQCKTWHDALDIALAAGLTVACVGESPKGFPTCWRVAGLIFLVPTGSNDKALSTALLEQCAEVMVPDCTFASEFADMFVLDAV
jgi:hypothetical protein